MFFENIIQCSVSDKYGLDINKRPLYRDLLVASDQSVMLMFVSESVKEFIVGNTAEKWELHMDGTFKILPSIGASQLFVVHINYERTVIYILPYYVKNVFSNMFLSVDISVGIVYDATANSFGLCDRSRGSHENCRFVRRQVRDVRL